MDNLREYLLEFLMDYLVDYTNFFRLWNYMGWLTDCLMN